MELLEEVEFEVATSILDDLIGFSRLEQWMETRKDVPDKDVIERLKALDERLSVERLGLIADPGQVEKVLVRYGPELKKLPRGDSEIRAILFSVEAISPL